MMFSPALLSQMIPFLNELIWNLVNSDALVSGQINAEFSSGTWNLEKTGYWDGLPCKRRPGLGIMYQSIPSLTIPRADPGEFFERANPPPPGYKESAKLRPLGQKNCAKTPLPGQLFSKIQQKNSQSMRQKL